ncbi:MAG: tol-pal system protein YbgF [Xanthomonadales bacterium]|nr:tol-pal system protein YbgF [Xanthomonadales bacterium]
MTFAAAALVAAVAMPAAQAQQRLSLAERVDRLEQQAAQGGGDSAVDMVNRISALQQQVQDLQGQVEELRHALDQAQQRSKDQYIDLDSRIGRLEGVPAAGAVAATPKTPEQPPDIELGSPAAAPPPPMTGTLPPADPAGAEVPADSASAMDVYNQAFAALKDGRYAESARRFQSFIDRYPDDALTGNAYYWLGESYYVTQNYPIAEEAFRTLLARYPDSQKAPDALLKIGYSQYEQRQWNEAEATLNQVVETYPDTTVARLAQGRLRALRMETQR